MSYRHIVMQCFSCCAHLVCLTPALAHGRPRSIVSRSRCILARETKSLPDVKEKWCLRASLVYNWAGGRPCPWVQLRVSWWVRRADLFTITTLDRPQHILSAVSRNAHQCVVALTTTTNAFSDYDNGATPHLLYVAALAGLQGRGGRGNAAMPPASILHGYNVGPRVKNFG
eukprot:scaffold114397_cov28-Tisochrysis_lutea.AAC.5